MNYLILAMSGNSVEVVVLIVKWSTLRLILVTTMGRYQQLSFTYIFPSVISNQGDGWYKTINSNGHKLN